jgi:hypothetical protein
MKKVNTDSITTVLATIKKDLPNLEPVVNFIQMVAILPK